MFGRTVFVATYPQRRCGIATFTRYLADSAIPAGSVRREHPDVGPGGGRFGDKEHPSHGLHVHLRTS